MSDMGYLYYIAFLGGDEAAIQGLVEEYSDSLIRYAYCYLNESSTAEDVMEETIATLIFKKKHFHDEKHFRAYLYKIARNKSIDYLRRRGRELPIEDVEEVLSTENTENGILKEERNRTIYICMQQLPNQYREVLYLTYFDEFDVREVCLIMKKTKKQVYNLLARAKADLKQRLVKEGITHEDL